MNCVVNVFVLCLFLSVPWVGLQSVIVVFSVHTHFPSKNGSLGDTDIYTTLANFSTNYLVMRKAYTWLGGIN